MDHSSEKLIVASEQLFVDHSCWDQLFDRLYLETVCIFITVEFANTYTYKSTLNMLPIEKYKRPEYKANIRRLYHYSFSFNLFHNERGNFHSSGKYKKYSISKSFK